VVLNYSHGLKLTVSLTPNYPYLTHEALLTLTLQTLTDTELYLNLDLNNLGPSLGGLPKVISAVMHMMLSLAFCLSCLLLAVNLVALHNEAGKN